MKTGTSDNARMTKPPRIGVLACSVFEKEIALLTRAATHLAEVRFFEIGLHDQPDRLRDTLQEHIDRLDNRTDLEAVVLAYGLCGRGTARLRTTSHPLVIPRAHDCITVFMGSKETYAEHHRQCPTCYYYTPGWNRARRVPGPDKLEQLRQELGSKFDPDDVEFLIETERSQWDLHDTATYLDLGTDDAEAEAAYARRCADWLGWTFERLRGDPSLLRDLLWGRWDTVRYQILRPGWRLEQAPDETIFRVEGSRGESPPQ
jgi:hypothetical protein